MCVQSADACAQSLKCHFAVTGGGRRLPAPAATCAVRVQPNHLRRTTAECCRVKINATDVRFWPLADISECGAHVCFREQSRHALLRRKCLLMTQTGHWTTVQLEHRRL